MAAFERKKTPGPTPVSKTQLNFLCTPEEFDLVDELRSKLGMTKAEFMRMCIREWIERHEAP